MGTERDSPGDSDGGGIHSLSKKVSDSRWFLGEGQIARQRN